MIHQVAVRFTLLPRLAGQGAWLMDVNIRLAELSAMHPLLLWDDIVLATVAVFSDLGLQPPFPFPLVIEDVPNFGSANVRLLIDPAGTSAEKVHRLRRTYDASRQVELAAIALAGLGLHHAAGHEIRDVAVRGSAADYLIDDARHLLEIAGRSRRVDVVAAWEQRWTRLRNRLRHGFYVCVVEFETPSGRLVFAPEP
jgi:hypothetical protein